VYALSIIYANVYSYLSASTGSRLAALKAGYHPKKMPTARKESGEQNRVQADLWYEGRAGIGSDGADYFSQEPAESDTYQPTKTLNIADSVRNCI